MKKNIKKNLKSIKFKWVSAIPFLCTILYFILAFCLKEFKVDGAYAWSALVFLLIPFSYFIIGLKRFRFSFPVFIAALYITICVIVQYTAGISLWHPLWVMFLLIPPYYIFFGNKMKYSSLCEDDEPKARKKYKNEMDIDEADSDQDLNK